MVDGQVQGPLEPEDAFGELGRVTLADHSVESIMDTIAALAKRTLPGASEVSVTLVEAGRASTVSFTGPLALTLDERQYEHGYGPCLDSIEAGEPVHIPNMAAEDRWPDFAAEAQRHGVGSSLSAPVPIQREISAALNIYSTDVDAFSDTDLDIATTFASYAAVALTNMHLYQAQVRLADDLQTAMKSRAVIEQAKGILMSSHQCPADEAFAILVKISQDTNRKLREVAETLVEITTQDQ